LENTSRFHAFCDRLNFFQISPADRDTSDGRVFVLHLRAMGIRDRPVAPQSAWQNAYFERPISSIGRECLDHMIVRQIDLGGLMNFNVDNLTIRTYPGVSSIPRVAWERMLPGDPESRDFYSAVENVPLPGFKLGAIAA
jgi:hypothetical protein